MINDGMTNCSTIVLCMQESDEKVSNELIEYAKSKKYFYDCNSIQKSKGRSDGSIQTMVISKNLILQLKSINYAYINKEMMELTNYDQDYIIQTVLTKYEINGKYISVLNNHNDIKTRMSDNNKEFLKSTNALYKHVIDNESPSVIIGDTNKTWIKNHEMQLRAVNAPQEEINKLLSISGINDGDPQWIGIKLINGDDLVKDKLYHTFEWNSGYKSGSDNIRPTQFRIVDCIVLSKEFNVMNNSAQVLEPPKHDYSQR
jgi:hypothetical protein